MNKEREVDQSYHWVRSFLERETPDMFSSLELITKELQKRIRLSPKEYTESGCDEPSIDIRLCVDRHEPNPMSVYEYDWVFRIGLNDYDQRHSHYCAASGIGLDTNVLVLLEELKDQILEQVP